MTRAGRRAYRKRGWTGRLKDVVATLSFLFLLILIAAKLQGTGSDPLTGPFRVVDGDTLAAGAERLRLLDIDAPELDQTCERGGQEWQCGRDAKSALRDLVARGAVECQGSERDRYGRLLVACRVEGQSLGGAMVRAGMAVPTGMITYQRERASAQADGKGLWAGTFVMPSEWRRERRLEQKGSGFLSRLKDVLSLKWL